MLHDFVSSYLVRPEGQCSTHVLLTIKPCTCIAVHSVGLRGQLNHIYFWCHIYPNHTCFMHPVAMFTQCQGHGDSMAWCRKWAERYKGEWLKFHLLGHCQLGCFMWSCRHIVSLEFRCIETHVLGTNVLMNIHKVLCIICLLNRIQLVYLHVVP